MTNGLSYISRKFIVDVILHKDPLQSHTQNMQRSLENAQDTVSSPVQYYIMFPYIKERLNSLAVHSYAELIQSKSIDFYRLALHCKSSANLSC